MTAVDAPQVAARKPRPPRTRRLTAGHVVPLVLAAMAFVVGFAVLAGRQSETGVLVAAQRIPAGKAIDSSDTKVEMIRSSDASRMPGLIGLAGVGRGLVATVTIASGQPIVVAETVTGPAAGSGLGVISIPVAAAQAAGGSLAAGDKVDVIRTVPTGAVYVAQNLTVVATAPLAGGSVLGGASGGYWVAVAADRQTALAIASTLGASAGGSGSSNIEVVRSTGETGTGPSSYTTPAAAGGSCSAISSGTC